MRQVVTIILAVLVPLCAGAVPTERQAAALYGQEDYEGAAQAYRAIIAQQGANVSLLYNLGNCYVKTGSPGRAMACYQEALAMDPTDAALLNNIRYLTGKVEDNNRALLQGRKLDVTAQEPGFLRSVQVRISEAAQADTYGAIALGAFVLMLAGVCVYIFARGVRWRKVGFFGALVCMGLTVLFNILAFTARDRWQDRRQAVVTAYEAQIYPEPSAEASPTVPKLREGTVLEVEPADSQGAKGWVRVRLNADYNGWMAASDLHML